MLDVFNNIQSFRELIDRLTPDIYQQLKKSVEIGKWPTGQVITQEQRNLCMQAVIAYEEKHFPKQERTGFVPPKKTSCDNANKPDDNEQILTLK